MGGSVTRGEPLDAGRLLLTRLPEITMFKMPATDERPIIEGTGSIHVLPEAPVEDLLALLDLAQATSISDSWDLEITKETAKLAFAEGQTAASMLATLSRLCGVEPLNRFAIILPHGKRNTTRSCSIKVPCSPWTPPPRESLSKAVQSIHCLLRK